MRGGLWCSMLSYLVKAEEMELISKEVLQSRYCLFLALRPFLFFGNRTTFYHLGKMSRPPVQS